MIKLEYKNDSNIKMKSAKEIEESIVTKYKRTIWAKFNRGITNFNMVEDGDKIAIAISGGKDSLLLAKLFQELKKNKSYNFDFKCINLNPGFREEDLEQFKQNLIDMDIDCEIIDTNIWEVSNTVAPESPCFLCAKMRRGVLYKELEKMGFTKIALGHHFDDIIETTLINIFYGGMVKTMLPKIKSSSGNMYVIRPLVYVFEKDIIDFRDYNGIKAMTCGCSVEAGRVNSKRKEIKRLLAKMEEENPGLKKRVFNSMKNVHLKYVFGYIPEEGETLNE